MLYNCIAVSTPKPKPVTGRYYDRQYGINVCYFRSHSRYNNILNYACKPAMDDDDDDNNVVHVPSGWTAECARA